MLTIAPVPTEVQLKIHTPDDSYSEFETVSQLIPRFDSFHHAFQHATGWSLSFDESFSSLKWRPGHASTDLITHGRLSIDDMSQLVPPGVHAVSRIYCQELVEQINLLLEEIFCLREENCRLSRQQDNGNATRILLPSEFQANVSHRQNRLRLDNLEITPLIHDEEAVFDWHIDANGRANFLIVCKNAKEISVGESCFSARMLVLRSAFQTACRLANTIEQIDEAIQEVVLHSFAGGDKLSLALGRLDLTTGEVVLTATSDSMAINCKADGAVDLVRGTSDRIESHIGRRDHLLLAAPVGFWSLSEHEERGQVAVSSAIMESAAMFSGQDPEDCFEWFDQKVCQRIPRLGGLPSIALLVSRI